MDESRAPAPLTPVVFHVLLALSGGPLHGYGVMKRAEQASGLVMGPGSVYGSLQRLEDAGWVRAGEPEPSEPRRGRVFHLTGPGRAALAAEARRIARLARLDEVRELLADRGSP